MPAVKHRAYPFTQNVNGRPIFFRMMTPDDGDLVMAFARSLPANSHMFTRWDITHKSGIKEWTRNLEIGHTNTVLALEDNTVVGYGSLHHNALFWTRHHGELRVMVSEEVRGAGLGRFLVRELFLIGQQLGLTRFVVQIASDQPRVRHMFEDLGFHAEALLADWLMDSEGETSDLIIMSLQPDHNV